MLKTNRSSCVDRSPLFPGKSCFPLSPEKYLAEKNGFQRSNTDQLNVIFSVIGTPNEDEYNFLTDSKAIQYLKSFNKQNKQNLKDIYPGSNELALDLIEKLTKFNPKKRLTVDEALDHPYFEKIRKKNKEVSATEPIILEFDKKEEFEEDELRALFEIEIKQYEKKL